MICFGILEKKKSQKRKTENLGKTGSYALVWDALLRRGRGAKIGTLRVRHDEGLRRSVAVLRRRVATIHSEHISDFCFRTPRICTPIV